MTVSVKQQIEVKYLKVSAYVRWWEDAYLNGEADENGEIPFRDGDSWCPVIELETGKIIDWPIGTTADVHYKVCDAGVYTLLDADQKEVKEVDGYVIDMMCPKENGCGDYIIMDIDENGIIQDWKPSFDEFENDSE